MYQIFSLFHLGWTIGSERNNKLNKSLILRRVQWAATCKEKKVCRFKVQAVDLKEKIMGPPRHTKPLQNNPTLRLKGRTHGAQLLQMHPHISRFNCNQTKLPQHITASSSKQPGTPRQVPKAPAMEFTIFILLRPAPTVIEQSNRSYQPPRFACNLSSCAVLEVQLQLPS